MAIQPGWGLVGLWNPIIYKVIYIYIYIQTVVGLGNSEPSTVPFSQTFKIKITFWTLFAMEISYPVEFSIGWPSMEVRKFDFGLAQASMDSDQPFVVSCNKVHGRWRASFNFSRSRRGKNSAKNSRSFSFWMNTTWDNHEYSCALAKRSWLFDYLIQCLRLRALIAQLTKLFPNNTHFKIRPFLLNIYITSSISTLSSVGSCLCFSNLGKQSFTIPNS